MTEGCLASERIERRLTAILAADIAGYSRLVEADEEGTLSQWKALWGTVIEPKIKEHRGRIVRVIGDGILRASSTRYAAPSRFNEAWPNTMRTRRRISGSNSA